MFEGSVLSFVVCRAITCSLSVGASARAVTTGLRASERCAPSSEQPDGLAHNLRHALTLPSEVAAGT